MLVTFSAIALGLTLNSSLDKLQHLNDLVSNVGENIVRLDNTFVEYGTDAKLAHIAVLNYARREAVELSADVSGNMTAAALQQIETLILRLDPPDPYRQMVKHSALGDYGELINNRFEFLTKGGQRVNLPFILTLGFWLMLTYCVLGLNSDSNPFVRLALGLSICGVVAASFVILDMDTPLGGLISVSREPIELAIQQIQ
jgi:hypothetical protein